LPFSKADLCRSLRLVLEAGRLDEADDLQALLDDSLDGPVPSKLLAPAIRRAAADNKIELRARRDGQAARVAWGEIPADWSQTSTTRTRQGLPRRKIRLARWQDDRLVPLAAEKPWSFSEISLPEIAFEKAITDATTLHATDAVQRSWTRPERDIPLLVMRKNATGWTAPFQTSDGTERLATYCPSKGFATTKTSLSKQRRAG